MGSNSFNVFLAEITEPLWQTGCNAQSTKKLPLTVVSECILHQNNEQKDVAAFHEL